LERCTVSTNWSSDTLNDEFNSNMEEEEEDLKLMNVEHAMDFDI
jgi:hypothetical protein